MRVVRVDPATGAQSYVASVPVSVVGTGLDCHRVAAQGIFAYDAFYFLADPGGPGDNQFARVLRAQV